MLLDTNALIWMIAAPDKLGHVAWDLVEGGDCFSSPISTAEIRIKFATGKLVVPDDLEAQLRAQGIKSLPFSEHHADRMSRFPELVRHDPFDRMLIAQAAAERLEFLTSDRTLLALGYDWIVDARR